MDFKGRNECETSHVTQTFKPCSANQEVARSDKVRLTSARRLPLSLAGPYLMVMNLAMASLLSRKIQADCKSHYPVPCKTRCLPRLH